MCWLRVNGGGGGGGGGENTPMTVASSQKNSLQSSFAKYLSHLLIVAANKDSDRQWTNCFSFRKLLLIWGLATRPWEHSNCIVPLLFVIHTVRRYLFTLSANSCGVHWIRGRTNAHALLRIAEWLGNKAAILVLLARISNSHGCVNSKPSFIIHIQRESTAKEE